MNKGIDKRAGNAIERLSYSTSLVTQGTHKFYTLTIQSKVLADTCVVLPRELFPEKGFQRHIDEKRAQQIAEYIDTGLGTIPTSIILSAQPESEIFYNSKNKTIEFNNVRGAFLILDGQHRVYGFSKAKTDLRVPVVIYSGLDRKTEVKLFIDINTQQRPVPNELILDIKKLAEEETDIEYLLGQIFDLFNQETDSPLLGKLSSASKAKNKISRVTFNIAFKSLVPVFQDKEPYDLYVIVRCYLEAFLIGTEKLNVTETITRPIIFRAIMMLFVEVAQQVKNKFGSKYTTDNFYETIAPIFAGKYRAKWFKDESVTLKGLYENFSNSLLKNFTL